MYLYHEHLKKKEQAQGLVEYALILVLVAIVVIIVLSQAGGAVGDTFCNIVTAVDEGGGASCGGLLSNSDIDITDVNYDSDKEKLKLKATYKGGADDSVTLTASPGGILDKKGKHYDLEIDPLSDCPCTVTITSSEGDSLSVTVG